jgi:hypothetical protein
MATSDKYDRQLRLWGANGQRALAEASVLLIGADGVGSETLKNLVLPGIGSFTILDDKVDTIGYVSKIVVVKCMGHRFLVLCMCRWLVQLIWDRTSLWPRQVSASLEHRYDGFAIRVKLLNMLSHTA